VVEEHTTVIDNKGISDLFSNLPKLAQYSTIKTMVDILESSEPNKYTDTKALHIKLTEYEEKIKSQEAQIQKLQIHTENLTTAFSALLYQVDIGDNNPSGFIEQIKTDEQFVQRFCKQLLS